MEHAVDTFDRLRHEIRVAHVALQELGTIRNIKRAVGMHLLHERIQDPNLVTMVEELARDIPADEATTAGDQIGAQWIPLIDCRSLYG
ncbi:hypothetical protein GCM10007276_06870 [Agaricicola taiwanensis]|uniref:Uncharacterized protein n=1 Tax=Agaricicola taiwanensis TaxID=591372 RepID=A0A8J2VMM9_9RHOB|nr:hypothetical protein GCM10007276_06870 [Agaricicola taiwanensis]